MALPDQDREVGWVSLMSASIPHGAVRQDASLAEGFGSDTHPRGVSKTRSFFPAGGSGTYVEFRR